MRTTRLAWALVLLAILARAAAVLVLQSHRVPHSTYEHGEIAENLLAGRGFSVKFLGADGPTSQQAPLYPVLMAGAYAIGGNGTPRALLILELGQAALGGLLVLAVLALARDVAPSQPRIALAAGLIAAVHPTLVYAATHAQVALLAATLLVTTLALAYRTGRTGRMRNAVLAGLALAALILTDPILGLAVPGAIIAVRLGQPRQRALKLAAAMIAVATLGIAPWIARNWLVHGEPVFIKSTFGYAFWQGNCALSEGTDKVVRASVDRMLANPTHSLSAWNQALWKARHEAGYIDDIALTASDYKLLAQHTEPERSRILFRRALADLKREPGRYAQLSLRRLRYFVLFDETNPKARSLLYRIPHLGLTLLAGLGLLVARPPLRLRLAPTFLTAALITLFHTLTIISARFHIPLEPLLGVWAAAGLSRLGDAILGAGADDVEGVRILRRLGVGRRGARLPGLVPEGLLSPEQN